MRHNLCVCVCVCVVIQRVVSAVRLAATSRVRAVTLLIASALVSIIHPNLQYSQCEEPLTIITLSTQSLFRAFV